MSFKKVENNEENMIKNTRKTVFTYEVNMIVSVFAEDEDTAREKLDSEGGFVSSREVELKDAVSLYHPKDHKDNK
jgi:hypothetical protein